MAERTCRLVTLGCKVNQYETQLVKETLEKNGYREAAQDEVADLCIVNTCTVTSTGDSKSRQVIRQLAKQNPGTKTIVMGCYATNDPQTVSRLPGVFEVVTDKRELPDVFDRLGIVDMPAGISHFDGRKRAYVKVQDGCVLRCSFCIIPQVRPGLRSRDPEDIEDEIRRLIDNGYQEIVMTGIHVGHYGVDFTRRYRGRPPFRLWHLFEKLDRIPGNWRMRLSSIEGGELTEELIQAASNCEHLCPQFHPALQSGSDTVLQRMRRRYRVGHFLEKLDRLRERIPDVAFTTDVIVGFPGETVEEFEQTVETCRKAEFMKIHIFPYSPRKGTVAAEFPEQVHPDVRKERCKRLAEIERSLAQAYYTRMVGKPLGVLVEREAENRPGWLRGTDQYYVPVELPGSEDLIGKLVACRGVAAYREYLEAEPIRSQDSPSTSEPVNLMKSCP